MDGIKSVNDFHQYITDQAVELANRDPEKDPNYSFTNASTASQKTQAGTDGLSMEWDKEGALYRLPAEQQQELVERMQRVGRRAVQQALQENWDLFVGVILGEARAGRDYFSRFRPTEAQGTLF